MCLTAYFLLVLWGVLMLCYQGNRKKNWYTIYTFFGRGIPNFCHKMLLIYLNMPAWNLQKCYPLTHYVLSVKLGFRIFLLPQVHCLERQMFDYLLILTLLKRNDTTVLGFRLALTVHPRHSLLCHLHVPRASWGLWLEPFSWSPLVVILLLSVITLPSPSHCAAPPCLISRVTLSHWNLIR